MSESNTTSYTKPSGNILISVLPTVFALFLILLLIIIIPRLYDRKAKKAEPRQKRLALLNKNVKAEHFVEWTKKEQEDHPELSFSDPLCVICLDEFQDASQIRGLQCRHVFHQECLDDWFALMNEHCPLCHGFIIPGMKKAPKKRTRVDEPFPIAFMV